GDLESRPLQRCLTSGQGVEELLQERPPGYRWVAPRRRSKIGWPNLLGLPATKKFALASSFLSWPAAPFPGVRHPCLSTKSRVSYFRLHRPERAQVSPANSA